MLPVMREDAADASAFVKPHLVVKLKPGWTFDPARRTFVSVRGKTFAIKGTLPRGSRIVPMVSALAQAEPKSLSADERRLARYFEVILPKGQEPATHLETVSGWESIAEVRMPSDISLPSPPVATRTG